MILASSSRWRLALLHQAGVDAEAVPPDLDEAQIVGLDAVDTARRRAQAKAEAVAAAHPEQWVLGADQVVHDGQEVFGKPKDPADHVARLTSMRGRSHTLHSAWALRGPGDPADGVAATTMHVREDVTDAEIAAYVAAGEGSGCAGGYMLEQRGAFLFRRVDGDFFNVLGLPLLDVMTALRARGWRHGP